MFGAYTYIYIHRHICVYVLWHIRVKDIELATRERGRGIFVFFSLFFLPLEIVIRGYPSEGPKGQEKSNWEIHLIFRRIREEWDLFPSSPLDWQLRKKPEAWEWMRCRHFHFALRGCVHGHLNPRKTIFCHTKIENFSWPTSLNLPFNLMPWTPHQFVLTWLQRCL